MQKTIATPEVIFSAEALALMGGHLPWVKKAVDEGMKFAKKRRVEITKVAVTRFDSYEDPDLHEAVITFYTEAPQSLEALSRFWANLSDHIGNWEQTLPKSQQEFFWKSIGIQVEPLSQ
ncbi:MAG: hypothetical protein HYU30_00450 [Chloroflexi bacterium]|nr:hypothetical protein [Chloroflexota bacterium]